LEFPGLNELLGAGSSVAQTLKLSFHALGAGQSQSESQACDSGEPDLRPSTLRRKVAISTVGALIVGGALFFAVGGHSREFGHALTRAPIHMVVLAVALQLLAVLCRSEAWLVCLSAAGATVGRRVLFRAAAVGCVASIINGSLGMAARIASLRRSAGSETPKVPALIAAEVPIIAVEVALAAIFSFTLIAPLGVPWWIPVIIVALTGCAVAALRKLSKHRQTGLWSGLAVMRMPGHWRLISFALVAVVSQVLRNWLMLHAIGVDVSLFDSMALLIVMFTVGQLPIGPSTGTAATVLILGSHGVAATAAAGVLLTATGICGSLIFASWALIDRLVLSRRDPVSAEPLGVSVNVVPPLT
jgi:uncharacterized membrane protein YbhN (UPF0104 family)